MHKVEIRLTNEGGDEPAANFEVYTEALKDGAYVDMVPMQLVAGGGAPIVLFLEDAERVVIVAKVNQGRLVFDKEQNANVRVETDEEKKRREEREANVAKSQAQQGVRSAEAEAGTVKELGAKAQQEADSKVRQAQAEASKVAAEREPKPHTATPMSSGAGSPHPVGNPASANTGPVDSKSVKKDG